MSKESPSFTVFNSKDEILRYMDANPTGEYFWPVRTAIAGFEIKEAPGTSEHQLLCGILSAVAQGAVEGVFDEVNNQNVNAFLIYWLQPDITYSNIPGMTFNQARQAVFDVSYILEKEFPGFFNTTYRYLRDWKRRQYRLRRTGNK